MCVYYSPDCCPLSLGYASYASTAVVPSFTFPRHSYQSFSIPLRQPFPDQHLHQISLSCHAFLPLCSPHDLRLHFHPFPCPYTVIQFETGSALNFPSEPDPVAVVGLEHIVESSKFRHQYPPIYISLGGSPHGSDEIDESRSSSNMTSG